MCSGPFRGVLNNVQEIWAKCWKNKCKGIPILIKLKPHYLQLYKNELIFKDFMQEISKFQLFAEFPHFFFRTHFIKYFCNCKFDSFLINYPDLIRHMIVSSHCCDDRFPGPNLHKNSIRLSDPAPLLWQLNKA